MEELERRRVLLSGDAEGHLVKLFTQVEKQQKHVGAFDVLFSVGAFLPGTGGDASKGAEMLAEYASGKRKAPIDTYFIDSRSAPFLQAAPEGKALCENITFLGGFGIREVRGLRVAYLSGHYDRDVYDSAAPDSAGPPFVGSAYTPQAIEGLIRVAQCHGVGKAPIDLLLTAEWPAHLEERLDDADGPKHPEGHAVNWKECGSPAVSILCAALEPRYHIFGTMDIFYARPPFQTLQHGHVCRCIGLGKVGSKGKARTWAHGLALSPAAQMSEEAVMQRPENTTPSPFAMTNGPSTNSSKLPQKRLASDALDSGTAGDDTAGQVVPNEVFLGRLPPNIDESRIAAALEKIGKIERIRLAREENLEGRPCRGFGWVTFSTPEEAEAACELSDLLTCNNRKILICLSRPRSRTEGGQPRKRQVQIAIEPHAECWFCLANPKVEKHMIVTTTTGAYVATARGPIAPNHVLVLPVKHVPCFAACPPELQDVLQAYVAAIRSMCASAGQDCLVWERWIPMGASVSNHMQLQVLPIDITSANRACESLDAISKTHMKGGTLTRISSHRDVVDHLNDDSTTPYIYFEVPGEHTPKGRKVERFVYAGGQGRPQIPMNFGRQVACHLLGCEKDKLDWRQCQEDRDSEERLARTFREQFRKFEPAAA